MKPDTIRILVSWDCNLKCSYCCNEKPQFRQQFEEVGILALLNRIAPYKTVCISGGEPLLSPLRVYDVIGMAQRYCSERPTIILYTNGLLLNAPMAQVLAHWGIHAVNVGLHNPSMFDRLIRGITRDTAQTTLKVRFHAQDQYKDQLVLAYPDVAFRFWTMDDCDRENEVRVILKGY